MAFLRIKFTVLDFTKLVIAPDVVIARAIAAVDEVVDNVEQDWHRVAETWEHKPRYQRASTKLTGGIVSGSIYSTDKNLIRLNNGTPPHLFGHGKLMSFHPKYRAKTTPGMIVSFPGGKPKGKKGKIVRRGPFKSKGIRARKFDAMIAAKHRKDLLDFGRQLRL